jgi:hypothetical protein
VAPLAFQVAPKSTLHNAPAVTAPAGNMVTVNEPVVETAVNVKLTEHDPVTAPVV